MDSIVESWRKAREWNRKYKESLPRRKQSDVERNAILRESLIHELWTGSRFERSENPIVAMSHREYMRSKWAREGEQSKPVIKNQIARSNPVTGDYDVFPM